ncbi:MAG: endonuclease/exonuclease/phosphatase family protein [Myxococcales bacterium]|nr:endonuclease/exonuclease/phosphatase family protein [Myxococcales bacterium]
MRGKVAAAIICLVACGRPAPTDPPDGAWCEGCSDSGSGAGADGGTMADAGDLDSGVQNAPDSGADAGPADFAQVPVYAPQGPLCDIPPGWVPDGGLEAAYLDCRVGGDRFSDRDPAAAPSLLKVVAWNVQYGKDHAQVLSQLTTRAEIKDADVLLMSEVARQSLTSNPDNVDMARAIAQAMRMDYAFAVEWDLRNKPSELGEHGVVILSKYPIGNATQIRHTPAIDWWKDDQRYGGRITLGADLLIRGKRLRVYSSHLCTRGGQAARAKQAAEIRADAAAPGRPAHQVVGGDLNTFECNPAVADCTTAPAAEQLVEDFLAAGWLDGTAGFNGYTQLGLGIFPQRLDWIFYRGTTSVPGKSVNTSGSDHLAIYSGIAPP